MKEKSFFQSRFRAIQIAFEGLKHVIRTQPNIKVYTFFSLAVVVAGWIFGITRLEWVILTITIGLVWMAETFNTAIEELVDFLHHEQHPRVKIVKDLSAGAVLICALLSVIVGILIFGPRLWVWIQGLF